MSHVVPAELRAAQEIIGEAKITQAPNGVCYTSVGETALPAADLERMVQAVPRGIAAALGQRAFYFVPLTVSEGAQTLVAERYLSSLADRAVCHRNIEMGSAHCVFISTRLTEDRFSLGFEFFINVAHAFVDHAGVSGEFADIVWAQATSGVRGETGVDAFELRHKALGDGKSDHVDEKARASYVAAAFADAIAVYMLSLAVDVDYYELRERDYPLLAPAALADRLKKVADLFPPNEGFEFNIFYRRRESGR